MILSILPAVLLAVRFARAENDWNVPCLDGQCSYDIQNGTARGTLTLIGSSSAISDITPAAGWTILDCDPNAVSQEIRLVCTGDEETCNHIYQGGCKSTLVRLPENCGQVPFARIVKDWTHKDQSIPSSVLKKIQRRQDGSTPVVRGIKLDTNWSAVDPEEKGNVTMLIQGSNAPDAPGNFTITPEQATAALSLQRRGLFDTIKDILKKLSAFDFTKSGQAAPVDIDKSVTLLDQSVSCPASGNIPAITESVKIGVDAKAHADIGYGIAAVGTVIPPSLSEFGIFASVDASLDGTLNIDANAAVTFDSGKIPVFSQGIPGLDFKQFLTIGPSFVINVEGLATVEAELNMAVNLAYNVTGAKLFFPPQAGSSSGAVVPADSNLKLSANPSGTAKASLEAHVIPGVQFGVTVLGGKLAQATIGLDVDASAKLTMSLEASAEVSTSASTNGTTGNTTTDSTKSGSVGGCIDLSSGVAVKAGADGNFLGMFDASTSVTLVSKEFDLFNKCFGNTTAAATKRDELYVLPRHTLPISRKHSRDVRRRGLTCTPSLGGALTDIINEIVSAATISSTATDAA